MSYCGEKGNLSFRDNFCEETGNIDIGEIANFGRILGSLFKRIAIGCNDFSKISELHILAGGIAKSGTDVFIINEIMPVFRYGIKSTECELGLYIIGDKKLKMFFFDRYGIRLSYVDMMRIYNQENAVISNKSGKISQVLHIYELYFNSLKDALTVNFDNNAVISCGNRKLTDLWRSFFSSETGNIIFQVSENGERVNCYSTELGFISYERLLIACAVLLWERGENVVLPESFHYIAEELAKKMKSAYEYLNDSNRPEVFNQRFTIDCLYMCIYLMNSGKSIPDIMQKLPEFYTAKREIITDFSMKEPEKTFVSSNSRINLSKSGKNRITLTVQSMNMETAAELCGKWEKFISERKNIANINQNKNL